MTARRSAATSSSCAGKAMRLAARRLRVDGTTRASLIWIGNLRWARAPEGEKPAAYAGVLHRRTGLGQGASATSAEGGGTGVNPTLTGRGRGTGRAAGC